MKEFFSSYKWLFLIGIMLILVSVAFSWWAYPSMAERDRRVSETVEKLDHAYSANSTEAKRQAIIELQDVEKRSSLLYDFLSHLAEALFLAGVMILNAEAVTKFIASRDEKRHIERISGDFDRRVNEISTNVWEAIFEKLVPDEIAVEIKKLLKSDVCRIRPTYIVTLQTDPYKDLKDDEIVVRRQLSYKITNLTGDVLKYPLAITVQSHTGERKLTLDDGSQVILPRICEVQIGGVPEKLEERSRIEFRKTIDLPAAHDHVTEIYSVVEELAEVNDRALYVLREPCVGVEIQVNNETPQRVRLLKDQVYLTSGMDRLSRSMDTRFTYDGGVLSGTAVSVAWERTPVAKPVAKAVTALVAQAQTAVPHPATAAMPAAQQQQLEAKQTEAKRAETPPVVPESQASPVAPAVQPSKTTALVDGVVPHPDSSRMDETSSPTQHKIG